ncbi:hypothetical protein ACFL96_00930 [Thermoproteota archaeon]
MTNTSSQGVPQSLLSAQDREQLAKLAGDDYTDNLETFRDELDEGPDTEGTSLGKMVETQIKMTEAETRYQVTLGIPTKASKAVKGGSDEVKRQAG